MPRLRTGQIGGIAAMGRAASRAASTSRPRRSRAVSATAQRQMRTPRGSRPPAERQQLAHLDERPRCDAGLSSDGARRETQKPFWRARLRRHRPEMGHARRDGRGPEVTRTGAAECGVVHKVADERL